MLLHNGPSASYNNYNNQIYSMPHSVKKALEIISQKGKVSQFFQETQFPETDVFSHGASKRADRTKGLNTGL